MAKVKCKWAGDVNDEYCKECDGLNMMVDGEQIACTECAGYEAGEEVVETKKEEPVKDAINPPVEDVKEEPKKEDKPKAKKTTKKATSKKEVENTTPETQKALKSQNTSSESYSSEIKGVGVLELSYTSGITVQKNDTYYKFNASEKWALDLSVINTTEKLEDVREKLWAKLNAEVDKQVEEVFNS